MRTAVRTRDNRHPYPTSVATSLPRSMTTLLLSRNSPSTSLFFCLSSVMASPKDSRVTSCNHQQQKAANKQKQKSRSQQACLGVEARTRSRGGGGITVESPEQHILIGATVGRKYKGRKAYKIQLRINRSKRRAHRGVNRYISAWHIPPNLISRFPCFLTDKNCAAETAPGV